MAVMRKARGSGRWPLAPSSAIVDRCMAGVGCPWGVTSSLKVVRSNAWAPSSASTPCQPCYNPAACSMLLPCARVTRGCTPLFPKLSLLREILGTYDGSSGLIPPYSEPRRGQKGDKGDAGDTGSPGKEVRGGDACRH